MNFWDFKSSVYSFFRKPLIIKQVFQKECHHIQQIIEEYDISPQRLLDIGTGIGDTLNILPDNKFKIGLDNAFNMVEKLTREKKDWIFLQADGSSLPFTSESFDFISAIGVCEYIKNKPEFLNEIKKAMIDDSYCLITIAPTSFINFMRNFLGNRIYTVSIKKWRDILNQSGLKILAEKHSVMQSQYLLQKIISE